MKIIKAIENFRTIIETAKSVKDKRLSEMTREEQHAIQFCSWIRYARENPKKPGKLTYTKAEDKDHYDCGAALCPAVVDVKKVYKSLQVEKYAEPISLLAVTSYAIMIDEEPMKFLEASATDCLAVYPDKLLIPPFAMTDVTNGTKPILLDTKPEEEVEESPVDKFTEELGKLLVAWVSPSKKLSQPQRFATKLILEFMEDSEDFLDTVRRIVPFFPRNIKEYHNVRTLTDIPKARVERDDIHKMPFKSFECSAVFLALKGLYIKV